MESCCRKLTGCSAIATQEQLEAENARLREDLGFYRFTAVPPVPAEIIARSLPIGSTRS